MAGPTLKIKKLFPDAQVPKRAHDTDSGLDLYAYPEGLEYFLLKPHQRALVNTGISATVGPGYEIQIRPRSGLAVKKGLTVLNTPGTVDECYRGALNVLLINLSDESVKIEKGMRIAQMVVSPVVLCDTEIVEDLSDTDRGAGGFGSTGE